MKTSKKAIALYVILATGTSSAQYYSIPNGYTNPSYNNRCNFSVTLLHPRVDKSSTWSIGRNFMGIISSKRGSEGRFIAFIIKLNSYSEDMITIASNWGISKENLIQGDGSHSSQIVSNRFELYGEN